MLQYFQNRPATQNRKTFEYHHCAIHKHINENIYTITTLRSKERKSIILYHSEPILTIHIFMCMHTRFTVHFNGYKCIICMADENSVPVEIHQYLVYGLFEQ